MHSINKELWEKSHKPSTTVAMGMKLNNASAICWKKQVEQEEQITSRWLHQYDPDHKIRDFGLEALDRSLAREREKRDNYLDPSKNSELYTILYRQSLEDAKNRFRLGQQEGKQGKWKKSLETAKAQEQRIQRVPCPCSCRCACCRDPTEGMEEAAGMEDPCSHRKVHRNGVEGVGQNVLAPSFTNARSEKTDLPRAASLSCTVDHRPSQRDAPLACIAALPPLRRTKPYLEARSHYHSPQQRYPGVVPPTSSMEIGWRCEVGSIVSRSSRSDLFKPVRPNVMGPYRTPEDASHAAIFGYNLGPH